MVKKIKLLNYYARLIDNEPFLLPDDNLTLNFKHQGYDLSNAFISLRNGERTAKYKFNNLFVVPQEFLFVGDLHIKVEMYLDGEKAKQWIVLPIRIRETDNGIQAFDVFSSLEKQIQSIKEDYVSKEKYNFVVNKLNEIISKQNELADTVSAMKEDNVKI